MTAPDIAATMLDIGRRARAAARVLALAPAATKDAALTAMAEAIVRAAPAILAANAEDLAAARTQGATAAFLDRLTLDDRRVAAMAEGVRRWLVSPIRSAR